MVFRRIGRSKLAGGQLQIIPGSLEECKGKPNGSTKVNHIGLGLYLKHQLGRLL